ncbi:hypothetical protein ACVBEG_26895 [Pseudomonas sp. GG8]
MTRYDYAELVAQASAGHCEAPSNFRNRDMGSGGSIGSGETSMTVVEGEVRSALMTLDDYRVTGTDNGVIF